jgi:hypothetical protein
VLGPLTRGKPVDVLVADIDDPPAAPPSHRPADRRPSEPAGQTGPTVAPPAGAPGRSPLPS